MMRCTPVRSAFTLVEVIVASLILVVLAGMVLETTIGASRFARVEETSIDFDLEHDAIATALHQDLGVSAWFDFSGSVLPSVQSAVSPWGDSITFVRLRSSRSLEPVPIDQSYSWFPFNGMQSNPDVATLAAAPVRLSRFTEARPAPDLIMPDADLDVTMAGMVQLMWESWPLAGGIPANHTVVRNDDLRYLRTWRYRVVAGPADGLGRLVREYLQDTDGDGDCDADDAWRVADVLSDSIESFEVRTANDAPSADDYFATASGPQHYQLGPNQIRISYTLATGTGADRTGSRRSQITVAMRSITSRE
jgi:prepilin-type N-terminal cleavage/methylation domain-containing protein